ncbi:hypothetical protein TSAR_008458 [Trichomalopsis sarcophagae]|uniref:Uncharacterized protein n=1 Tax=Trichomalopsis sarcophagae TaxID=543379 RepID=A0A232FBJ1_9HYME|nr:hypothetical protein TSAR_008458 [Trichomalopsis sarcophagae]
MIKAQQGRDIYPSVRYISVVDRQNDCVHRHKSIKLCRYVEYLSSKNKQNEPWWVKIHKIEAEGPVMSLTFGSIIADKELQSIGLKSLCFGICLSILFGFIFGLILGTTEMPWGYNDWPTDEMKGRTERTLQIH